MSIATWLPHHQSNSSEDLLEAIASSRLNPCLTFLRQLPIELESASALTINQEILITNLTQIINFL
jgi:pyroglutamyl-peptidase